MKSLHNTDIIRPDVEPSQITEISIRQHFGKWSEQFKDKYLRNHKRRLY